MPINAEIDAMAAQVANLRGLSAAVDSGQPIKVSIGEFNLDVDPAQTPDAYSQGASLLRSISANLIAQLYAQIAPAAVAVSLEQPQPAPASTPPQGA